MSTPSYYQHPSGLQVADISMHLPHPLASAFEYVARAGIKTPDAAEDLAKALSWLRLEAVRRSRVSTQSKDAELFALHLSTRWTPAADNMTDSMRCYALGQIVNTACNWMHPDLLQRARDAVAALRDRMVTHG